MTLIPRGDGCHALTGMDLRPLLHSLETLPQEPVPRTHPRHWAFRLKRAADFFGHARPETSGFFRRINPYPKPWQHKWLRADDGVDIAAWYGPVEREAPFGLVLVPGMFSTKDDTIHKRRALRMWRAWDIPIVALDLRAFGESKGIATGGWKESLDIHAAARFLVEEAGVGRVALLAESMGGAAALNALAHDARSHSGFITGGALCFSAFVDVRDAVNYISSEPPKDDPFHMQWAGFRRMLRFRSSGGYENFRDYMEDAARVNGLASFDELVEIANPKWKTSMIEAPTLLVHAADDPVVPVRHARRMERYAKDQTNIQVMVTSWGQHTGFEGMDPWWFWEVMRRFYGTVNGVELAHPSK